MYLVDFADVPCTERGAAIIRAIGARAGLDEDRLGLTLGLRIRLLWKSRVIVWLGLMRRTSLILQSPRVNTRAEADEARKSWYGVPSLKCTGLGIVIPGVA